MAANYLHGVETIEVENGARPVKNGEVCRHWPDWYRPDGGRQYAGAVPV